MRVSAHGLARILGSWQAGPGPRYQRLSDGLRLLILDGRLGLGTTMPGERDAATALGVSRTTVTSAYQTLVEHAFLETRPRSRATVRLPDLPTPRPGSHPQPTVIDLSVAAPAAPVTVIHAGYATALEQLPRHFDRSGYDDLGLPELREAVARSYERRGLPTSPEQIMITNGALHAVGLLTRVLLRPRDTVVIDHPSYPHAIRTFLDAGARLATVGVTDDGWDVAQLRAASRSAALAYLIPDHHNPTGMCMSTATRHQLKLSCPMVIDETMADLTLDGTEPEPFGKCQPAAISVGSAAKSIWGGLRIGWLRAEPSLLRKVVQRRPALGLGTPVLEQLAAAVLIDAGPSFRPDLLDRLRQQREALLTALADRLPDVHAPRRPGGLSVWTTFPEQISSRLAAIAPDFGLLLAAGPRFGVGGAFQRNLRIPFTLDPQLLTEGVDRLQQARRAISEGRRGAHDPASVA
ncbi:MAG: PLP-dependent aminotransferase family protein [Janthinobacterium lividum]